MSFSRQALVLAFGVAVASMAHGEPSTSGQTGLINMPSARIEPDGTWTLGFSYARPYVSLYGNLTVLPFMELTLSGRRIMYTPAAFGPNSDYGDNKDKRADIKLRLWSESEWLPEVAIGAQDFIGTRLFGAEYIVGSKRLTDSLDVSLGYGRKTLTPLGATDTGGTVSRNRLAGVFGGARLKLNDELALVAERDPIDYSKEPNVATSRIDQRRGNTSVGIEYRHEWLGVQASHQGNEWSLNTFVQVPLNKREFLPKFNEPEPYARLTARPSLAQWQAGGPERTLRRALDAEEFGGVAIRMGDDGVLHLQLGHPRISQMARAVGRAARIALLLSPLETREIRITYLQGPLPVVTYAFFDLDRLRRYFNGQITRRDLAETVDIRYAEAVPHLKQSAKRDAGAETPLTGFDEERERPFITSSMSDDESGHVLALRRRDRDLGSFELIPFKLGSVVNDPSGFYQFQVFSELAWSKRLGDNLFLDTGANLRLYDTFQEAALANSNNSLLPHVRTDVSRYIKASRLRLDRFTVSQYYHLAPRWYGRVSAGIYEMMFSGVGGQVLYMPENAHWAADVAVDAVRQRDFSGWLKHQSYSTVTALGSLHYRFPMGFKTSVRAGKFLARDVGARIEMSRRFTSGMELGGWLTVTDNQDLTASGSTGKPYKDKGVFLNIPFEIMMPKDSRARGSLALAEWNRDVGKTVDSPNDLYRMMEKPLIDREDHDGLSRFGDVDDDYNLPSLGTGRGVHERPLLKIARDDAGNFGAWLASVPAWGKIGLGLGAIAASTALDNRGLSFADKYGENRVVRYARNIGNLLPFAAGGAALAVAVDGRDRRLADTGFAAIQAGSIGYLASEALKYAIHRSRPSEGKGARDFNAASRSDSSMPSNTTTLMWAVTTPFAKEYHAPWLYGVAALTNLARVSGNKHWVSDTVASSVLGYGLGSLFWEWRRRDEDGATVAITPGNVTASWTFH
ncbi:MAG: YjbH domain-containing protein [Sulfuritalea sp.]|jgi:membrane-associated phospholipid phosphatase|nr:YjbH domain-containing protein [Sulfuritalea sp.]